MQTETIEQLIKAGLAHADVYVEGDGTHFSALVVSPEFAGKTRIQKQQMVLKTVESYLLNGSLHALSIKALTPAEWDAIEKREQGQL
jgi:acid stress-induced BolA-like protein IbaG/YrbA